MTERKKLNKFTELIVHTSSVFFSIVVLIITVITLDSFIIKSLLASGFFLFLSVVVGTFYNITHLGDLGEKIYIIILTVLWLAGSLLLFSPAMGAFMAMV